MFRTLAAGDGWRAGVFVCAAGPADRPFEEAHTGICIAPVTHGTFRYRTRRGAALLAPGAVLLGEDGACFECGHEHGTGDRCLSFHYDADYMDGMLAGFRVPTFHVPALPPGAVRASVLAAAQVAAADGDPGALEEAAAEIAGAAAAALSESTRAPALPNPRDVRRVSDALRRIGAAADAGDDAPPLAVLARDAGSSPFQFLRVFRATAGITPHQFLLQRRLHCAAVRLRRSQETVAAIAFACGFGDLSTFNRQFRRAFGCTPLAWRAGAVQGARR